MTRLLALWLFSCGFLSAQVAPVPTIDAIGGHPFSITKKWVIGGTGNWDTLTMDPKANQLFIAHGPTIQVVDVSTGSVIGTVDGFSEAHAVALDDSGSFAFASDGPADMVRVFDRTSFKIVANIPTGPRPRALAIDPQTGLLLAICSSGGRGRSTPPPGTTANRRPPGPPPAPTPTTSIITVIDPTARQPLENLTVHGLLALAQADGLGHVYVAVEDRNQIAQIDVQSIAAQIRDSDGKGTTGGVPLEYRPQSFRLPQECRDPRGVAVDGNHQRIFVTCNNMKMTIMNGATGEPVKSLTIGPGAQAIAYDSGRNLIFTANGGGYGSLSVISQDVTDSYNVVQNLPTLQQARTLAVNSSTGEVYLVTSLYGAKIDHPPVNGLGTLKMIPVESSFQVLVIGN